MCKRLLTLFIFICLGGMMQAKAQQLNYQAIARNANGVALTFRDVGIRLSIRDKSQTGSILYSETRNVRTNQFGLFTVVIGSPGASNTLGSMASINWISGNKYLQVEIDPEGGNNYFQAGTSQLQAVPYALFANAAYPVGPAGGDLLGSNYPNPIIAPLAVTAPKIGNQAVTTQKIADLNITTIKLADQSVNNAKIQDNTISNVKLVNSKITLNGLTLNLGETQDFAIGNYGNDVNIISAEKTHTFNFPDASITNRGLITPNTQTIGGNKIFKNNITANSFIKSGGIASQFLKADGSVDNNTYLTSNQPITVTTTGDVTGVSNSNGTAPVLPLTLATVNNTVGTFGDNISIPSFTVNNKGLVTNVTVNSIPTATANTSGLLTVGDWNSFNNKQNAIPLGKSSQYFRGDLTLGNFTNDVRNQLSAGTNITYANGNIGLTNNSVTINALPLVLGGSQNFATGNNGNDFNISSSGSVHSFNIPTASATNRGLLSPGDFSNFTTAFNSRIIGLTTNGSSGSATLIGNSLNIPNYTLSGLGGEPSITSGTTAQYWRGDKTWQTLNTTIVPEGTQQYFTQARARTALSLSTVGNNGAASYDNTSGTFNIPNYTLSGLGGEPSITSGTTAQYWRGDKTWQTLTSDVTAEGSTNLFFTPSRSRTALSLNTTGNNGAATYDNTTGTFNIPNYTLSGLGGEPSITSGSTAQYWRGDKTWQTLNTTIVPEGTQQYFTQARSRTALSLSTVGNNGAASYDNTSGTFNIPNYTLSGLGGEPSITFGTTTQYWRGDKTWQTLTSDAVGEGSTNLYFTNNRAQNAITLSTNNTSGAATYSGGILNIPNYTIAGLGGEPSITAGSATQYWRGDKTWQILNTTNVTEGTNEYFTQARARAAISLTTNGSSGLSIYNNSTGILNIPAYTFDGLSPMTSTGDIIYRNASGNAVALSAGTNGQVLTLASGIPSWASYAGWTTTGNSGLVNGTNFIGTNDFAALRFRVNGIWAGEMNPITTNTSYGYESGLNNSANTNTANNTSVGFRSLKLTTINGVDNTAVGQGALETNIDGDNNTAIGQGALNLNTGTSNTAVGQAALRANTSSNRNTGIGRSAIENIISGEDNTALGYIAGRNFGSTFVDLVTNPVSSLSQSVMLGSNTRPSANGTTNEIVIGYNAVGNGSNTIQLGNTSITKVNTSGAMNATKFVGKNGAASATLTSIDASTTGVNFSGNDAAGTISFTTTSAISVGNFLTITFGTPYENAPVILINAVEIGPSTSQTKLITDIFCLHSNVTTNLFRLTSNSALTPGRTYQISYHVIGR